MADAPARPAADRLEANDVVAANLRAGASANAPNITVPPAFDARLPDFADPWL